MQFQLRNYNVTFEYRFCSKVNGGRRRRRRRRSPPQMPSEKVNDFSTMSFLFASAPNKPIIIKVAKE